MLSLPGEFVRTTGVYEVTHSGHRPRHEALLFAEEIFPRCRECGDYVIFRFIRPVSDDPKPPHISADADFRER